MCNYVGKKRSGIILRRYANDIAKELFRKVIHLCAAFIPFFLKYFYVPVLSLLSLVLVLYIIAEILRYKGKTVPIFSVITQAASRKRDENKFVLGPVTLSLGISAFVASILPINSTKIYSNFTLYCGFESCIIFFIFFCALITIIAFIFTSKQREIPFWISPTPYFVVMYFGYIILTTTDDFLALFLGSILLGFGSCGILSKLHKYYLWK